MHRQLDEQRVEGEVRGSAGIWDCDLDGDVDIALAGVACRLTADPGGIVGDARVVLGAVGQPI